MLIREKGYRIGFGNLKEPIVSEFKNWEALKPSWRQTHGVESAEILAPHQSCGDVDALYTLQKNTPISVVTADCVPIIFASKSKPFASAIHAGWKGTRAQISKQVLQKISVQKMIEPEELIAWIGPAIGPCCYEVSEEMISDFSAYFSRFDVKKFIPSHRHLDLQTLNQLDLQALGVNDIRVIRECTKCTVTDPSQAQSKSWKYASYRREGSGVRQFSTIQID